MSLCADLNYMDVQLSKILADRMRGQNISKVARELNIPKQRLFDWVAARRLPSMRNAPELKRIADYLGLEFEELLFGVNSKQATKVISSVIFEDRKRKYRIVIERIN